MKPPACVRNKWGSGTTCERAPPVAKEVQTSLEKMMAERVKQDSQWFAIPNDQTKPVSSPSNDPGMKGK